ncbi:TPA: hypothetical protein ACH3X1_015607 [Trebouxia sp. C0004]
MLDAGLLDSPSPFALRVSFRSLAPAVRRRDVSPVPFGSVSCSNDADEGSARASASAAMDSFRQAAAQTGIPDIDNARGVLADQMLGDVMSLDEMLVGFNSLEAGLQVGVDQGSLVSGGVETASIATHQPGGSKPGVLSHMTGQEMEAILLADSL